MEEASVMMSGLNSERILQCLKDTRKSKKQLKKDPKLPEDYNVNFVSEKIIRIISSYVDYVNTFVWKNKKMRILILSQYFWPENFRINEIAMELINLGNKVTVITGKPKLS